jgi:hypothetical protein
VIDALKHGHAFATSGPMIEMTSGVARMGDSIADGEAVTVHVKVRVAPWIDASELEIYAGGESAMKIALPERPLIWGEPSGSLEDARRDSLVFDRDITIRPPKNAHAIVAVVRGNRSLGLVLPFMDFQPMAIGNPLLLQRR